MTASLYKMRSSSWGNFNSRSGAGFEWKWHPSNWLTSLLITGPNRQVSKHLLACLTDLFVDWALHSFPLPRILYSHYWMHPYPRALTSLDIDRYCWVDLSAIIAFSAGYYWKTCITERHYHENELLSAMSWQRSMAENCEHLTTFLQFFSCLMFYNFSLC